MPTHSRLNTALQHKLAHCACTHTTLDGGRHAPELKLAAAGVAREGHGVPDVAHARDETHEPLEAQPIAAVRHRAVAAQVKVPPVSLLVEVLVRVRVSGQWSVVSGQWSVVRVRVRVRVSVRVRVRVRVRIGAGGIGC